MFRQILKKTAKLFFGAFYSVPDNRPTPFELAGNFLVFCRNLTKGECVKRPTAYGAGGRWGSRR